MSTQIAAVNSCDTQPYVSMSVVLHLWNWSLFKPVSCHLSHWQWISSRIPSFQPLLKEIVVTRKGIREVSERNSSKWLSAMLLNISKPVGQGYRARKLYLWILLVLKWIQ